LPAKNDPAEGMNLLDLFQRDMTPKPWAEGEKIPWDDPEFSQRMLKEHLSQKHDAASRRKRIIKKHVDWIHRTVLNGQPSCILDLGCGPGLYTAALAGLGHVCRGIDFSPASIDYAVKASPEGCTYTLGDIRATDFRSGYDLVMFIFGEFNVFRPQDATLILQKSFAALQPGGRILLEIQTFDAVYELGNQPATWYSAKKELFADDPHLCLMESFWDEEQQAAIERYYIVDVISGNVRRYASTTLAYHEDEIISMLTRSGFRGVETYPTLTGKNVSQVSPMLVLVAEKCHSR